MQYIKCSNLNLHNLKSISLCIPKNQFTVITGVSGSGKSTLVFDILNKVGQTQYLSAIDMIPDKEIINDFDIQGLCPTVCVSQNLKRQTNPRSTVGSRTGMLSLLQSLFAQIGKSLSSEDTVFTPSMFSVNSATGMCFYCYGSGMQPEVDEKAEFRKLMLSDRPVIDLLHRWLRAPYKKYCKIKGIDLKLSFSDLDNDAKEAVLFGDNEVYFKGEIPFLREGIKFAPEEQGFKQCHICNGTGLRKESLNVKISNQNIAEYKEKNITSLYSEFKELYEKYKNDSVASHLLSLLLQKCQNLIELDLGYLNLNRKVPTLSGGEFQRLLMSTFFDFALDNLVYVFDEPTLGLHESEKKNILNKIKKLSAKGNTVFVVEHDLLALKLADHIVELGPGGGTEGGNIIFEGSYNEFLNSSASVINNTIKQIKVSEKNTLIPVSENKSEEKNNHIFLQDINTNNLKNVNLSLPLNNLIGIVGVSGSGKSSLISHTLVPLLDACEDEEDVIISKSDLSKCKISGIEKIKKKMLVSQKPIGRNKKSMVVSYMQIWEHIRKIYLKQALSDNKKFTLGHFSFNSEGACEKCHGEGEIVIAGANFTCDACGGNRYKKEVCEVKVFGYNIVDILDITISEALKIFENEPKIKPVLAVMEKLGLGYLKLGQSTKTISGGEAQRIKLAIELCKTSNENSLYVLDEPTAGLSCHDTAKLLKILKELVSKNNTVIIIEHDLQAITECDWLVELGPGSGDAGGRIIAEGTINNIIQNKNSLIAPYCKEYIEDSLNNN